MMVTDSALKKTFTPVLPRFSESPKREGRKNGRAGNRMKGCREPVSRVHRTSIISDLQLWVSALNPHKAGLIKNTRLALSKIIHGKKGLPRPNLLPPGY